MATFFFFFDLAVHARVRGTDLVMNCSEFRGARSWRTPPHLSGRKRTAPASAGCWNSFYRSSPASEERREKRKKVNEMDLKMAYSEAGGSLIHWVSSPYRELLPLAVGVPGLGFEDKEAAGAKVTIRTVEETTESNVTPVQVNPLRDTQTQNHIKLLTLSLQQHVTVQHIVPLRESERQRQFALN